MLEIARRQRLESIEEQKVGGGAELSILLRLRTQGALRQSPRILRQLPRVRPSRAAIASYNDGLDVLGAHHGAITASTRVSAIVRDTGVSHLTLAGRADDGDRGSGIHLPQSRFGLAARQPAKLLGVQNFHLVRFNQQYAQPRGAPRQHQRIAPQRFAGNGEAAADERVVEALCERALANHGELRRSRQRAANQRAEDERQTRLRRKRVQARGVLRQQQPGAQAGSSDISPQHLDGNRQPPHPRTADVDHQAATMQAVECVRCRLICHACFHPPASAARIKTTSPSRKADSGACKNRWPSTFARYAGNRRPSSSKHESPQAGNRAAKAFSSAASVAFPDESSISIRATPCAVVERQRTRRRRSRESLGWPGGPRSAGVSGRCSRYFSMSQMLRKRTGLPWSCR